MGNRIITFSALLMLLSTASFNTSAQQNRLQATVVATESALATTMIEGCPIFPTDNVWNQDISTAPLSPHSDQIIKSINESGNQFLHADFGFDPDYGIP